MIGVNTSEASLNDAMVWERKKLLNILFTDEILHVIQSVTSFEVILVMSDFCQEKPKSSKCV